MRHLHIFLLLLLLSACTQSAKDGAPAEDRAAKRLMQGVWANDIEGTNVFEARGDTLYYNDTLAAPVAFHIVADTLYLHTHPATAYHITRLTAARLTFTTPDGETLQLTKAAGHLTTQPRPKLNQRQLVKRDTIVGQYHAYTQINPTTYKVYRTTTNSDGIGTEAVYYDNIVHIAVYQGARRVYGHNIVKSDFRRLVPEAYIRQAVLSDIAVAGMHGVAVRFVATLAIPDSYTTYRINIDIDSNGHRTLSL